MLYKCYTRGKCLYGEDVYMIDKCFEIVGNIHETTEEQLKEWGIKK